MAFLNLFAKLNFDGSQLSQGLDKADKQAKAFGANLGKYFSAAVLVTLAKSAAEAADNIQDMAEQLDVTIDKFQLISATAARGGFGVDAYRTALTKISEARGKVLEGDEKMIKNIELLGLSLSRMGNAGFKDIEILEDLQKAIQRIGNFSIEQKNAYLDIVGTRGGGRMLGSLKAGFEPGHFQPSTGEVKLAAAGYDESKLASKNIGIKLWASMVQFARNLYWGVGSRFTGRGSGFMDLEAESFWGVPQLEAEGSEISSQGEDLIGRRRGNRMNQSDSRIHQARMDRLVGSGGGRDDSKTVLKRQLEVQQKSERHLERIATKPSGF